MPAKASIRQLRLEFPKVRALVEREGKIIITERGVAAYVLLPYVPPRKTAAPRIDYWKRLRGYMPKAVSQETERQLEADRDDR